MYTWMFGIFQSIGGYSDIILYRAGQRAYRRPGHCLGYLYYRIKITGTRHRETSLNHINSQAFQRPGHFDFLNRVQLTTGHLLSISESSVKNVKSVAHKVCTMLRICPEG